MILTCVVTNDRLPLTKRCIGSLLATARPQDRLIVVDNHSTDGSVEWLKRLRVPIMFNPDNRYPGAACNQGWDEGLKVWQPELLHRSDNDIEYLPGWQGEVESVFATYPGLALLGILNLHEDRGVLFPDGCGIEHVARVGGNVVMPTALFRAGLRWDEGSWGAMTEDGPMSDRAHGYGAVAQLVRTVANNMAFGRFVDFPDYYRRTALERGIGNAERSV